VSIVVGNIDLGFENPWKGGIISSNLGSSWKFRISFTKGIAAMTQQGFLLIADITGYTTFLTKSELEHAQGILDSLLKSVLIIPSRRVELIRTFRSSRRRDRASG